MKLRQTKAIALMIIGLLLFSSCSGSVNHAEKSAEDFRREFNEATKLETVVNVRADYGDRVYDFSMKYLGSPDTGELTIIRPDTIAGLIAHVSVSDINLQYDGVEFDTGAVTGDGLSPAGSLPVLVNEWKTAFIVTTNFEKLGDTQTLVVVSDITDHVRQKTWFEAKTLLPLRSEISQDGRTVVFCEFEDFILE